LAHGLFFAFFSIPLSSSSLNGQAFPCHTARRKKEREARKVKYNVETVVVNS
jgi:hypothetical protein